MADRFTDFHGFCFVYRMSVEEELKKHRDHLKELVAEQTKDLQKVNKELRVEISEHKQTEEALLESEERLLLAMSAADMGTWRWNPETNQYTRDASFNRILGLEAKESTQPVEDFFQRVHPHDRKMVEQEVQRARKTQTTSQNIRGRITKYYRKKTIFQSNR